MYNTYVKVSSRWVNKIPSYWQFLKIKEILVKRKEKNNPIVTDFILSLSARNGVTPYHERTERGGNKPKNDLTQYDIAHKNDLLINCMNIVAGSVGITKWKGAISPVYYALYPRSNRVNIRFAEYIFRLYSFQRSLIGLGKGIQMHESESGVLSTVRMRIPMSSLNNIELPLPPRLEQDKIVRYLDWKVSLINKYINVKKKQIEFLKEQKQTIINQAVTKGLDPKAPMKNSGIKWLGKIPAHWEVRRVKHFALVNPSIRNFSYNFRDKVVFLPMEKISVDGTIDNSIKKRILEVKSGFSSFAKNDVIIAKITPCFENGKGAFLNNLESEIGFGTTELFNLRVKENMLPEYLYWMTMSSQFRILGERTMTGTAGQKRITSNFVSNFTIAIPSVIEQNEIVDFIKKHIDKIHKYIDSVNNEIQLLQEYRTRLISDVVNGRVDVQDEKVPEFQINIENASIPDIDEEAE